MFRQSLDITKKPPLNTLKFLSEKSMQLVREVLAQAQPHLSCYLAESPHSGFLHILWNFLFCLPEFLESLKHWQWLCKIFLGSLVEAELEW